MPSQYENRSAFEGALPLSDFRATDPGLCARSDQRLESQEHHRSPHRIVEPFSRQSLAAARLVDGVERLMDVANEMRGELQRLLYRGSRADKVWTADDERASCKARPLTWTLRCCSGFGPGKGRATCCGSHGPPMTERTSGYGSPRPVLALLCR